jgi:2-polyprenyl-3-methyl-5-hydroxy-6-metoxy-1,4-benzoquinol methylase
MNQNHKPTRNHKQVFDEQYFTDYYMPMTGSFTHNDLIRNKNWFYGWFNSLQSFFDFKHGKNRRVLEIGCSIGAAADILYERGFRVIATDISSYAVKNAKKLLPHIKFEVLDIDATPKYKDTFDLIYSFEVIEHLENPLRCLKNMYAMLDKGGSVICSTPYPYPYVFFDKTHISVKYPDEWIKLFREAGFKNVQYKQVGFVPFFYRYSPHLHIKLPFGVNTKYINSPVFIYGEK